MIPDLECITARILAQELRDMMATSKSTVPALCLATDISEQTIRNWIRGFHLEQPVKLFAMVDALGYDVVFRKRSNPRRKVRLR